MKELAHDHPQRLEGCLVGGPVGQRVAQLIHAPRVKADDGVLLGGEVVVEGPHGHVSGRRDLFDGDVADAALGPEAQRGGAQRVMGRESFALAPPDRFNHGSSMPDSLHVVQ